MANAWMEFKAHTKETCDERGCSVVAAVLVLDDGDGADFVARLLNGHATPETLRTEVRKRGYCQPAPPPPRIAVWHEDMGEEESAAFVRELLTDAWTDVEVFGYIWYSDGSFSRRDEYFTETWWAHYAVREMPPFLEAYADSESDGE